MLSLLPNEARSKMATYSTWFMIKILRPSLNNLYALSRKIRSLEWKWLKHGNAFKGEQRTNVWSPDGQEW